MKLDKCHCVCISQSPWLRLRYLHTLSRAHSFKCQGSSPSRNIKTPQRTSSWGDLILLPMLSCNKKRISQPVYRYTYCTGAICVHLEIQVQICHSNDSCWHLQENILWVSHCCVTSVKNKHYYQEMSVFFSWENKDNHHIEFCPGGTRKGGL